MSKCFNFFSHVESPVMWAIGVIEICRVYFLTQWFLVVVMLSVFNIRQVIGWEGSVGVLHQPSDWLWRSSLRCVKRGIKHRSTWLVFIRNTGQPWLIQVAVYIIWCITVYTCHFLFCSLTDSLCFTVCKCDLLSQDLTVQYNDKKASYDSVAAGLESNRSKLEMVCSLLPFIWLIMSCMSDALWKSDYT